MNFSLRTALLVTAIVALLLGAVVSKSPLFLELVSTAICLGIALTLPLAIWDHLPARRAFWTGFFTLGFASLLMSYYFHGYQQSSSQLATLMVGKPAGVTPGAPYNPQAMSFFQSGGYANPGPSSTTYVITSPNAMPTIGSSTYYEQLNALRAALPSMFSLLAAAVGGWITLLVWRGRASEQPAPQPEPPASSSTR
jgi:hypothetical protein